MYIQCFLLLYTCAHTYDTHQGSLFIFFVGLDNDTYTS